jgi:hypothetical protein
LHEKSGQKLVAGWL